MELREALIRQNPSLTLQRAASAEIAILDGKVSRFRYLINRLKFDLEMGDYDTAMRRVLTASIDPDY